MPAFKKSLMCIRDSKSGVSYIVEAGGSVRDDHVIDTCNRYGIVLIFNGVRPVSYTHLDVYKRQTNDSTEAFMKDVDRLNAGYVKRTGVSDYWFNRDLAIYFGDMMPEVTDFAEEIGADFGKRILSNPTLYEPHDVMRVLSCLLYTSRCV